MKAKLTLTLDKDLIEEVKAFAKSRDLKISTIVENHLRTLLSDSQNQETDQAPVVDVAGMMNLDHGFDLIEDYTNYLIDWNQ